MNFWGELYRLTERFPVGTTESEAADIQRWLGGVSGEILDVGCGDGRHVQALRAAGLNVRGVDFDAAAAGDRGDMRALPYETCRFAAAYCVRNTSMSFGDDELALVWSELARVIRPGGLLFVTVTSAVWARRHLSVPLTSQVGDVRETTHFDGTHLSIRRTLGALTGEVVVRLLTLGEWGTHLARHGFELRSAGDFGPLAEVVAVRALTRDAT